jgi:type IV secretory pathway VirJ component
MRRKALCSAAFAAIAAIAACAIGTGCGSGDGNGAGRGEGLPRHLPRHLPLVEVAAEGASAGCFAILLTGDGGWAALDRGIARRLAERGIPVVGWSSPRYLWKPKSEERAAEDLAAVIEFYGAHWRLPKVALLGYSRGADALPAMAARLPDSLKARIREIGLLGAEPLYELEFRLADWIPGGPAVGKPVLPELLKLKGLPILCLYGTGEKGSLCPGLDPSLARVRAFPGGHHLGGDYRALADTLFPQESPPDK